MIARDAFDSNWSFIIHIPLALTTFRDTKNATFETITVQHSDISRYDRSILSLNFSKIKKAFNRKLRYRTAIERRGSFGCNSSSDLLPLSSTHSFHLLISDGEGKKR